MLARRFLWIIAGLVILLLAAAIGYRLFERQLMKAALVPSVAFEEAPAPPKGPTYVDAELWIARRCSTGTGAPRGGMRARGGGSPPSSTTT